MPKKKTKLISAVAVCLFLAACGEKEPAADAGNTPPASENSSEETSEESSGTDSSAESPGEGGTQNPYTKPESLESNEDIENARKYIWYEYLLDS